MMKKVVFLSSPLVVYVLWLYMLSVSGHVLIQKESECETSHNFLNIWN